jgi:enoyl-CoA hydratase/carnithine racemase
MQQLALLDVGSITCQHCLYIGMRLIYETRSEIALMGEFVNVEIHGPVGVIRLHRPPLNILNLQAQDELAGAAKVVEADPSIRSAVIYGGEKTFAAGADIKEMSRMNVQDLRKRNEGLQHGFNDLARLSKPLIAAVTGYALGGGCELALCADLRYAADNAVFGQPEVRLGIMPGCGGTQRLPRLIGPARAKDLMLTGRQISADEAYRMGLADLVVPAAEVLARAMEWAQQFAHGPSMALQTIKQTVDAGLDTSLEPALAVERRLFARLFESQDKTTGMEHFLDKTGHAVQFTGK